jgi:release factor glutamine methyltransferase
MIGRASSPDDRGRQLRADAARGSICVRDALHAAAEVLAPSSESPRLDAEVLLAHVMGWPRSWLLGAGLDPVGDAQEARFLEAVRRRAGGEPVAYLTGIKEFWSLPLQVSPAVLIPRPETELLVDWALEILFDKPAPRIADLGTGSGAIALALASERADARIAATDNSAAALAVARANAEQLKLDLTFIHGRWFEPLAGQRFDLIVSNPPYVAAGDPHLQSLRDEPSTALVAGGDGLEDLLEISRDAAAHLEPAGWLLLEHGAEQGDPVRQLLLRAGFSSVETRKDLAGQERATGGSLR